MTGLSARAVMTHTLPELWLAMRGWQRAQGMDPDGAKAPSAMSKVRLMELAERYG